MKIVIVLKTTGLAKDTREKLQIRGSQTKAILFDKNFLRIIGQDLYQFLVTSITDYHKLSGIKQLKYILLQF